MLKIKGKEYPVSFYKIVLEDSVSKKLEFLREHLGMTNNIEAFTFSINTAFKILIDRLKIEQDKESEENK